MQKHQGLVPWWRYHDRLKSLGVERWRPNDVEDGKLYLPLSLLYYYCTLVGVISGTASSSVKAKRESTTCYGCGGILFASAGGLDYGAIIWHTLNRFDGEAFAFLHSWRRSVVYHCLWVKKQFVSAYYRRFPSPYDASVSLHAM